jgi:hypothetical protein
MLEGKCPKCGYYCAGWALQFARHQTCPKCGVGLEIIKNGRRVGTGYSPFTAEKYSINLPDNVSPVPDEEKEILKQDKQDSS